MPEWTIKEENTELLLHDCVISDAKLEDGNLVLTFEDGIWLLAETELNPSGDTIRTGKAHVTIRRVDAAEESSWADICKGVRLFARKRLKLWRSWSMEKMLRCIRTGKASFAILSMHRDSISVLFSGVVHMRRSRFSSQYEYFYWKVQAKGSMEIHFEWDGVRPDCTW